ncbi:MAG: hypothetical protein WBJ13_08530, partial [Sedimentibacter sp.]
MSCNRSNKCRNRNGDVLGDSGIQRIALSGPGCISGTGQCDGVLGTGGRFCCEEVLGTGGSRCCEVVLGTGGRIRPNTCRNRCDHECLWDSLITPTT